MQYTQHTWKILYMQYTVCEEMKKMDNIHDKYTVWHWVTYAKNILNNIQVCQKYAQYMQSVFLISILSKFYSENIGR